MSEAYSKPCQISKMLRWHVENPGIEQFIQAFSDIFRNIQQYSPTFRDTEGQ